MARIWSDEAFYFDSYDMVGALQSLRGLGLRQEVEGTTAKTYLDTTYRSWMDFSVSDRTAILAGENLRFDDPKGPAVTVTGTVRALVGSFTEDGSNDGAIITGLSIPLSALLGPGAAAGGMDLRALLQEAFAGADVFDLSNERDLARGFGGNDVMNGRGGDDTLHGGSGHDRLNGEVGNDRLFAGSGRDLLAGGSGQDSLYGGVDTNRDVFDFDRWTDSRTGEARRDVIHDFRSGIDDIDLRDVDARRVTSATNEEFEWGDRRAGTHDVWWTRTADGVLVQADVTGDAKADFEILLVGVASVAKGDFLL